MIELIEVLNIPTRFNLFIIFLSRWDRFKQMFRFVWNKFDMIIIIIIIIIVVVVVVVLFATLSFINLVLFMSQSKGLFTWSRGAPANRATLGEPTFHTFL